MTSVAFSLEITVAIDLASFVHKVSKIGFIEPIIIIAVKTAIIIIIENVILFFIVFLFLGDTLILYLE